MEHLHHQNNIGRWAEESLRLLLFSCLPLSSLFMALQTATSKAITKEQTRKQKAGARHGIETAVYVVKSRFQNQYSNLIP